MGFERILSNPFSIRIGHDQMSVIFDNGYFIFNAQEFDDANRFCPILLYPLYILYEKYKFLSEFAHRGKRGFVIGSQDIYLGLESQIQAPIEDLRLIGILKN